MVISSGHRYYSWIVGLQFLLIIGILGCLGALNAYGHISNNAQSWFKLGSISVQPSEFAKVIIIMFAI